MKKKTLNIFISEAKTTHNHKYDYSKVEYINNATKVIILCPEHGEFSKTPVKHINSKQGCPKCGLINQIKNQSKDTPSFISESKLIHGDLYDYSKVNYINYKRKVNIICPEHGEFEQLPNNHLRGKGCKYCGGTSKLDTKLFIIKSKEIHHNKYDYSKVEYVDNRTPITIICPEHGEFNQLPNNHTSKKQGCYECLGRVFNTHTFIKGVRKIHDNNYDYSKVDYVKNIDPVTIICPEHGEFNIQPNYMLNGSKCPKCINTNTNEQKLKDFISSLGINIEGNNRTILNGKELDIYIPSHNLAIEYNGLYWHSELYKTPNYHLNKTNECEKLGIKLIHIFEDEWLFKQEIVKSRLKNILGLTKNNIYARKCEIREVNTKDKGVFLEKNHIQGKVGSNINLGLYYNDELVNIMTFGKPRMNKTCEYELLRFCNKLDTNVVGGASKLLKNFIKTHQPKEIISYADRRWSNGNLYDKLGFTFKHNSLPNFFYIKNKKRENRIKYQKHKLVNMGFNKDMTANDIMFNNEYYKIYDSGNKVYTIIV